MYRKTHFMEPKNKSKGKHKDSLSFTGRSTRSLSAQSIFESRTLLIFSLALRFGFAFADSNLWDAKDCIISRAWDTAWLQTREEDSDAPWEEKKRGRWWLRRGEGEGMEWRRNRRRRREVAERAIDAAGKALKGFEVYEKDGL